MFIKYIPNICNRHGTNIMNANNIGSNTVQQNDINWSKRILGNDALTHIKVKIIIQPFKPKLILVFNPCNNTINILASE